MFFSAIYLGADFVIQSLHKTLPSFTQTALLHVMGNQITNEKIEKYLSIYQTSSPSYLFMAGIDSCVSMLENNGQTLWENFFVFRDSFIKESHNWNHIKVYDNDNGFDPCKLVISVLNTNITGKELQKILLKRYHLQIEMAAESYIVAIITMSDTKECFERLYEALTEIDSQIKDEKKNNKRKTGTLKTEAKFTIAQTSVLSFTEMLLEDTRGKTAFDYINLYPPGIPILVPGEVVTDDIIRTLLIYEQKNLHLQGVQDRKIRVIKEINN